MRGQNIDIKLHLIRDVVANGRLKLKKIGTKVNHVNALTKVLPKFVSSMKTIQVPVVDPADGTQ